MPCWVRDNFMPSDGLQYCGKSSIQPVRSTLYNCMMSSGAQAADRNDNDIVISLIS